MESLESTLKSASQVSEYPPIEWSNGTGYGDGYGGGQACGSVVQIGFGVGFKELRAEGFAGLKEYNGKHVYHVNDHPLVLSDDKKEVFEIQNDMTLLLLTEAQLKETLNNLR